MMSKQSTYARSVNRLSEESDENGLNARVQNFVYGAGPGLLDVILDVKNVLYLDLSNAISAAFNAQSSV